MNKNIFNQKKKKKKKQVLGCREQVQAFEVFFIIQKVEKVEKEKTHNEYQLLKGRISMTEQFSFKKKFLLYKNKYPSINHHFQEPT